MPTADPTETLERKIVDFSTTLTDDELTVLHEVLHLAAMSSPDVEGFAALQPDLRSADPCEGGRVTFANTFAMLGNLHTALHVPGQPGGPKVR
jgi:hypothetical protein